MSTFVPSPSFLLLLSASIVYMSMSRGNQQHLYMWPCMGRSPSPPSVRVCDGFFGEKGQQQQHWTSATKTRAQKRANKITKQTTPNIEHTTEAGRSVSGRNEISSGAGEAVGVVPTATPKGRKSSGRTPLPLPLPLCRSLSLSLPWPSSSPNKRCLYEEPT